MQVRCGLALVVGWALLSVVSAAGAQPTDEVGLAGVTGNDDLIIAEGGGTRAAILVSPDAGPHEKAAAADLAKYIAKMIGSAPVPIVVDQVDDIANALQSDKPLLIVGSEALKIEPTLRQELEKAGKKNPTLRADTIVLRREGRRIYLAGSNDDAHYYAVAKLLGDWGCRWYLPTEFGECIPHHAVLKIGKLDHAYGSPLEVRGYRITWNGSTDGQEEFTLRNMMNHAAPPAGHALGQFEQNLIPAGKSIFNVPISDSKTAETVAGKISGRFAKGEDIALGMEDGRAEPVFAHDGELAANLWDKYTMAPVETDGYLELYNNICRKLLKEHPTSASHIGFLAYSNATIPPQREVIAEKPLIACLTPTDIDPNHAIDDPRSPATREYGQMVKRWSQVMQGRVYISDYDQGMLIWRDLPDPSLNAIRRNMKFYAAAGVLGVETQSRNAIATTFLNLYLRGQMMWDPEANPDALLADFYPRFYGPAGTEMAAYWGAIYRAWNDTLVTEHEYFVIPAIYTPKLVDELRHHLEAAESAMSAAGQGSLPAEDWKKYQERMRFTRLSFDLIYQYTSMVHAAAAEADYATAADWGDKAVATRKELAKLNPTFTTHVVDSQPESAEEGPAWLLGEVKQYRDIQHHIDGTDGKLVTRLPLEWSFRRDPHDTGLASGWAYEPIDLTYWNNTGKWLTAADRRNYPDTWEKLRTDLYAQAQGVLHPDGQSYTGYMYYRAEVGLTKEQTEGKVHLFFPGLFNEGWLYVNGHLVAHREQQPIWWVNDYAFTWNVDLSGKLKPGTDTITLRLNCQHHLGGIFRRPFIYAEAHK